MQIKLLKTKNKFSHSVWSKMNPLMHWHIALCLIAAMILLSFSFGFYLFTENNGEINTNSVEDSGYAANSFSLNRIQKILNIFSEREKKSENILNTLSTILDPSI